MAATARPSNPDRTGIDRLNIALIAASALLALRWPFETLLLAYAVLGPLHYLTEISWLHDRDYFLPRRRDAWPLWLGGLALIGAVIATSAADRSATQRAIENGALFVLFGFALVLVATPAWWKRLLALAVLAPACLWLAREARFADSLAGYLPTVVHVYVFTGLFMLLGWLRRPGRDGALACTTYLVCPLLCLLAPLAWSAPASGWAERAFLGTLSGINALILDDTGLGDTGLAVASDALVTHPASVLVTRALAFAYLYHYLNWFSKVDLIGWAKIPPKRGATIVALWVFAVGFYFHDYALGFMLLLALSFLHVVLEFPLNHRAIRDIGAALGARRRAAR
ncbi:MAG: hypothetical protein ACOY82_05975 [Pseudomonadota bacterium]